MKTRFKIESSLMNSYFDPQTLDALVVLNSVLLAAQFMPLQS